MIAAEATIGINRGSKEVLEFVLDLDQYRKIDTKIGRIIQPITLNSDHVGTTKYWGRLRFLPPAPDKNIVRLTPWTTLTFTSAPRQPARLLFNFRGSFRCEQTTDGCIVTHAYELGFRRPLKWILEPVIARWFQASIVEEVSALKRHLEGSNQPEARRS